MATGLRAAHIAPRRANNDGRSARQAGLAVEVYREPVEAKKGPADFLGKQREAPGLENAARKKIVVMEEHDDLYYYWKSNDVRNVEIVHIDPHCDLHGALIHQSDQYFQQIRHDDHIHQGNFLVFAIKEGMVKKIRWVFDEYGDRKFDDTTVKYETDLSARLPTAKAKFKNLEKVPLGFSTIEYKNWQGFSEGEHLSLDWDFFAFIFKDNGKIREAYEEFLERDLKVTPDVTYICYSHAYVHPSSIRFSDFVSRLAAKFDAEIVYFEPEKKDRPEPGGSLARKVWDKVYYAARLRVVLWLRRRGIT